MSEQFSNSLLALARQQVFDEYIKAKADDLAEWLIACDKAWKDEGVMLPYPTFSFYPSEEDIIARARLLSEVPKEQTTEVVESVEPEEIKQEEVIAETEKPNVKVYYKHKRKWKK